MMQMCWKCDWCGAQLEFVNDYIRCSACFIDKGKNEEDLKQKMLKNLKRYLKTFPIVLMILFLPTVFAVTNYVGTPTSCPSSDATNYPGQSCTPNDICGDSSGIAQCFDTSTISAPVVDLNSTTNWSGSFNGGYLTDCYATVDASAPFCDNSGAFWCDSNSSCQDVGRITTCAANKFQADAAPSFCSTCRTGFTECDGSLTDADGCEVQSGVTNCAVGSNNNINSSCTCVCDSTWNDCDASGAGAGNGCEIQTGAVCTVGSLSGTYSGCTCVIPKQTFETGTNAQYNEDVNSLLWGTNYGDGNLAWLFNADANLSFRVDANSNVFSDNNVTAKWLKSFDLNVGNVGISNNSTFWRFSDLNSNSITACGSDVNSVQNSRGQCVSLSNFHLQGSGSGSTEHYTAGGNLVLDTADNNKFHFNDTNFLSTFHLWSFAQRFSGDLNALRINSYDLNFKNLFVNGKDFNTVYDSRYVNVTGDTMSGALLFDGANEAQFRQSDTKVYSRNSSDLTLEGGSTVESLISGASKFSVFNTGAIFNIARTAGVDYSLEFYGQDHDGAINWFEDEDYFRFDDNIWIKAKLNLSNDLNAQSIIFKKDLNSFVGKANLFDLNVGQTGISNNSTFYAFLDMNRSAVSAGCSATQFLGGDGACHTPASGGVTGLVAGWGMDTNSFSGDVNISIDETELTARNHTWAGTHNFTNTLTLRDDLLFNFGTGLDTAIEWTTTGNDNLQLGVVTGSAGAAGYFSLMEKEDLGNANRSPLSIATNPTFCVWSADATDANQYSCFSHNQMNPIFQWGQGGSVGTSIDFNGNTRAINGYVEADANGMSTLEQGLIVNNGLSIDQNSIFQVQSSFDDNLFLVNTIENYVRTDGNFNFNGTNGLNKRLTVRDALGLADCTIDVNGGIITASTC